jgi:hypothetical protein
MNPFKIISTKKIYENPWISVREDGVIRPDGSSGIFGVVTANNWSHVVAIDSENQIILNREFCFGMNDFTFKIPWGWISKNESPLDAAKKELREEAWTIAETWIGLGSIYPLTTIMENIQYIFLAKNIKATHSEHENGEIIENIKIPFSQALEWVMEGKIVDASSVAGILKAQYHIK